MKNKYAKHSRISERRIQEVTRYFAAGLTALQIADLANVNRNTVNRIYRELPKRILIACEKARPMFGVVEVDESLFDARRVKGKRGHVLCWVLQESQEPTCIKVRYFPRTGSTIRPPLPNLEAFSTPPWLRLDFGF